MQCRHRIARHHIARLQPGDHFHLIAALSTQPQLAQQQAAILHHIDRGQLTAPGHTGGRDEHIAAVWAFGIGPLAGILAIALHSAGANGKLFAEAIENADLKAWEGVQSAGGSWVQCCRYAVLPQVLPNIISYLLLRFEVNIRSASVIGFVGAGGVGEELYKVISFNYYEEISAIVVLIILTVSMVDLLSERLRHAAIGRLEGAR